jgi:predicted ATP-grasp superfamily ATP-dependent carboligase
VLVTDQHERSGLAVARSLHAAGFRVTAVAPRLNAPGLWSRAARRRQLVTPAAESADDFVHGLEQILRAHRHGLLIAVGDDSLAVISRQRARLEPLVTLGLPAAEVVERALDREVMASLAADAGFSPPPEIACSDGDQAVAAARSIGFPVLVKPWATVASHGSVTERRASRLARDESSVRDAARSLGPSVVQAFLGGSIVSFAGVAAEGGLLAYVASRYLRTWPVQAGNASYSEVFAPSAELVGSVTAFVTALGWEGMFELELIERSDGYRAIDFNPRPYGSLALALAAGVPLPAIWARHCLGLPPGVFTARAGVRYRWEDGDFRHILWQVRRGRGRGAAVELLGRRGVTHAYFRLADPGPLGARAVQFLQQEGPALWRRLRRRLRG